MKKANHHASEVVRGLRIGAISAAKVLANLYAGPATARELMEVSGLSKNTVMEYLRHFKTEGVIHICAWERDSLGRWSIPVFQLGYGKDRTRPQKQPNQGPNSKTAAGQYNRVAKALVSPNRTCQENA